MIRPIENSLLELRLFYHFAHIWKGTNFTNLVDHDVLKCILHLAGITDELMRGRIFLSKFKSDILHIIGVKNPAADSLSRLKTDGTDTTELDDDCPEMTVSLGEQG